jgi:Tfp pilus assembly protein PilX
MILSKLSIKLNSKGTVLIIAFLILGVLMLLGLYFLSFTMTESRIAKSQSAGNQAYYLAEAGINKAIWKLKNEDPWKSCFATTSGGLGCNCNNWQASFVMHLTSNSTTTVGIKNSSCAQGVITATTTLMTQDKKISQRVVKTSVFKELAPPTQGAAILTGGASQNIAIWGSNVRVYGNLFANNQLHLKSGTQLEVYDSPNTPEFDGKIMLTKDLKLQSGSVSSTAICGDNICQTMDTCDCVAQADKFVTCNPSACNPKDINPPSVDFDSSATTSFKSRAQAAQNAGKCRILCNNSTSTCGTYWNRCVLTSTEFQNVLNSVGTNGTTTLNNAITYVTNGGFDFKCSRLVVNGELLAEGGVTIGTSNSGCSGVNAQLNLNISPTASTSGLLARGGISFGQYSFRNPTTLTGVIYAYSDNNKLAIDSLPQSVTLIGAILGRKIDITNTTNWLTIVLDNDVISNSLGYIVDGYNVNPVFSPIILSEHWEESY